MVQAHVELLVGAVGVAFTLTVLHLTHFRSIRAVKAATSELLSKVAAIEKLPATQAICADCESLVVKFKKGEDGVIRCVNCLRRRNR